MRDDAARLVAPYGAWESPLGAADIAAAARRLSYATSSRGHLYWIESRPDEGGRSALMSATPEGFVTELSAADSNVRSLVHEYGGRPYVVSDSTTLFCQFSDQRLYAQGANGLHALTPEGYRYADGTPSIDQRSMFWVREDHTGRGEAVNTIVSLDLGRESAGQVLFDATDFVAYPRQGHDGRLAFIAWNHPHMPWDATALYVGTPTPDGLRNIQLIAGGPPSPMESVLEPIWAEDGTLYFLSDKSGYWNLYRWRREVIELVAPIDGDLGGPLWNLGFSTYALTRDGRALVRICRDAVDSLALVDLHTGQLEPLALPYSSFDFVGVLDDKTGFAIAESDHAPPELITFDLRTAKVRTIRTTGTLALPREFVSPAMPIEFPTVSAAGQVARTAHAFFFPPTNPGYAGPAGIHPPLIVLLHGGPTGHASPALNLSIQFWTTRGFAVVNVNYGGSSGFGRAYRDRLHGQWGVVDLNDAVAAVDHLVSSELVDGARVAIRGGSAGGYTVLAGLAFTRRFAAGISYFGVSDLESLAAETHKFESRYLEGLIAPLPEGIEIYRARSPIHHLESLDAALIAFQGDEDKAVPPEQSRRIVEAMRARGKPVAYIEFKGEQHGFRDAANIRRALEAELYFLGKIFGFVPAGALEHVPIDNLI